METGNMANRVYTTKKQLADAMESAKNLYGLELGSEYTFIGCKTNTDKYGVVCSAMLDASEKQIEETKITENGIEKIETPENDPEPETIEQSVNSMEQIGKGAFSTVYQKTTKTVLIKSDDFAKECMSNGWFPNTPMFPTLEHVGTSNDGDFQFYECSYYPKVKSLKKSLLPSEYEFYQVLRKIFKNFSCWHNDYMLFSKWHEAFDKIPNKFSHKRKMLKEALDAMGNYGTEICFEISPRNVAVKNKRLILLDCFFVRSQLDRKNKIK